MYFLYFDTTSRFYIYIHIYTLYITKYLLVRCIFKTYLLFNNVILVVNITWMFTHKLMFQLQ